MQAYAVESAAEALSRPGPGTTTQTPSLPAHPRITIGHVGGRLFVTGVNDAELILPRPEGVEESVELYAGQSKKRIDAMADQHFGERVTSCHPLRRPPRLSDRSDGRMSLP